MLAKSFARIHRDNLINNGILPLTFKNEADYDGIGQMDVLALPGIRAKIAAGAEEVTVADETTGREMTALLPLTERQRTMLLAGGLLNAVKEGNA